MKKSWLPEMNSWKYHLMLMVVSMFVLGPIGAVVGTFMFFALGFSMGGNQVFSGILGSIVTFGYGKEGRHGGNFIQTAGASVAAIGCLGVLVQARVWLGLPEIPAWIMMLYIFCISMFGIGVGMLYTPIIVDKMQLTFPSGFAVANILRALTDPKLLRASIGKLGTGIGTGAVVGFLTNKLSTLDSMGFSIATVGVGMITKARITVPALIVAVVGAEMIPYFCEIGWLAKGDEFRKIGFAIGLGLILGAAIVDIALLLFDAARQLWKLRNERLNVAEPEDWKRVNTWYLVMWVAFWGIALFLVGIYVLGLPVAPLALAIGLSFVFVFINGISMGVCDSNNLSAAFVIGVLLMVFVGLKGADSGVMCAAVLLVSSAIGVDMMQDRSTGRRLGTNRRIQFVYQVAGVFMGCILCVFLAKLFLSAFPGLQVDLYANKDAKINEGWSSAFTYKLVAVIRNLTNPNPHFTTGIFVGIGIGFVVQALRKLIKPRKFYEAFVKSGKVGFATDFAIDLFVLPSPYAASFGGFVPTMVAVWFGIGGIISSFANAVREEALAMVSGGALAKKSEEVAISETKVDEVSLEAAGADEMSTTSLVGGGLIAGEAIAIFGIAVYALIKTIL